LNGAVILGGYACIREDFLFAVPQTHNPLLGDTVQTNLNGIKAFWQADYTGASLGTAGTNYECCFTIDPTESCKDSMLV